MIFTKLRPVSSTVPLVIIENKEKKISNQLTSFNVVRLQMKKLNYTLGRRQMDVNAYQILDPYLFRYLKVYN